MTHPLRIGLVVPHMFMHRQILPKVIFSPGQLALDLASGLQRLGGADVEVTLFSPGPLDTSLPNVNADLSYFEQELALRGDSYLDLLKKHPFTFITLARQVQSELLARAYKMADNDQLDIIHVYSNEEDTALPFAALCRKPVVFTHHDPFNFLAKYRSVLPKYKQLNWLSMSLAQRAGMPVDTNWVGNIYHGLLQDQFAPNYQPAGGYVAYLGRIIEPKGLHLAITAVKQYNAAHPDRPLRLKIAGKHYAGYAKDTYWHTRIAPHLDGAVGSAVLDNNKGAKNLPTDDSTNAASQIEYIGFINSTAQKQEFLGNAAALLVPSTFDEPFGMVSIEALACGTPVIGLDSGAIPELITHGKSGFIAKKTSYTQITASGKQKIVVDESKTSQAIADALAQIPHIDRQNCRKAFDQRFTLDRMCKEHLQVYKRLAKQVAK